MKLKPDFVITWVRQPLVLQIMNFLFKVLIAALVILSIAYSGFAWYVHTHKKKVLKQVTQLLNDKISGSVSIGNMETTLLEDFPKASIKLKDIILKDSLYNTHKNAPLIAGEAALTVNSLALLKGDLLIKKITLRDASINSYTDKNGYCNTKFFFKKGNDAGRGKSSLPELNKAHLENVSVTINNEKKNKLHKFKFIDCKADVANTSAGWKVDVDVDAFIDALSFNTNKGSFINRKTIKTNFEAVVNDEGIISIAPNKLKIGNEIFSVKGKFYTGTPKGKFALSIESSNIYWHKAYSLLPVNISGKLNKFSFTKPIAVKCELNGFLNVPGEPYIRVNAGVKRNNITTPGGIVKNCSFMAVYTNEHLKGRGFNDYNSIVLFTDLKGSYADIPFSINKGSIQNLKAPTVTGNFSASFGIPKLKQLVDDDFIIFKKGDATVDLYFKGHIKDFKLHKPQVQGKIQVKDATINYVPRNMEFNDINVALNFVDNDLHISKIDLNKGKSSMKMEGSIKNFLNLYYTDPQKVVLNWQIESPRLYLTDFMGFAGSRKRKTSTAGTTKQGNFTEELNTLLEKSSVNMKLRVNKLYHKDFYATGARADIALTEKALQVKNASLNHAGGYIRVDGHVLQNNSSNNQYAINAGVANVDVSRFFASFDNFGMEVLTSENLKGRLSSKASINGKVDGSGTLVPGTMKGDVSFTVKQGLLVNFEPIRSIGKFAFPNRDINNITFYNLNGRFNIIGDKVIIHPMQVSSSVLNMDIEGIYSFGEGTQIYVDVPIRNPKRDEGITDKEQLEKRRKRGIVLHLVAEDDKDGKVKIKLGRKKRNN